MARLERNIKYLYDILSTFGMVIPSLNVPQLFKRALGELRLPIQLYVCAQVLLEIDNWLGTAEVNDVNILTFLFISLKVCFALKT
jgi:hypothetical protein